jgi:hypothetical protein
VQGAKRVILIDNYYYVVPYTNTIKTTPAWHWPACRAQRDHNIIYVRQNSETAHILNIMLHVV